MIVLGIETSCDETSLALVEFCGIKGSSILGELILSQDSAHRDYGGVVPEIAAREHLKALPLLYRKLFQEVNIAPSKVDVIAVTVGPGLKGCLLTGMNFAQGLSMALSKPLIGVNHIEGHVISPFLDCSNLDFPYLALIVSGGHTELIKVKGVGNYEVLGRTLDDAAGEAFDKTGVLLGLEYPAGRRLAQLADMYKGEAHIPRFDSILHGRLEFSFSGLKTAVKNFIRKISSNGELSPQEKSMVAKAVQSAITSCLEEKTRLAISKTGLRRLVIAGGVAANRALRERMSNIDGLEVFAPSLRHCTDNAAMIALCGGVRYESGLAQPANTVRPRWFLEEL